MHRNVLKAGLARAVVHACLVLSKPQHQAALMPESWEVTGKDGARFARIPEFGAVGCCLLSRVSLSMEGVRNKHSLESSTRPSNPTPCGRQCFESRPFRSHPGSLVQHPECMRVQGFGALGFAVPEIWAVRFGGFGVLGC